MIPSRVTLDYNYLDTKARLDEVMHSFIPDAEILSLKRYLPKEPDSNLVQIVALHRWNRRVCNCFKSCPLYKAKSQSVYSALHLCPKCSCTWYCSADCQAKDAEKHAKWCCRKDAEPDQGALRLC